MTTFSERFQTHYGDVLEITYDGTMHVAPSNGSQHATRGEAMRVELAAYLRASGDQVDEDTLDLDAHGEWIEDEDHRRPPPPAPGGTGHNPE